jgi:hypothetical protein
MEKFYIIEEPALVAQLNKLMNERDEHRNKFTAIAKEYGFIEAYYPPDIKFNIGEFVCSGFYIGDKEKQKVDLTLWESVEPTKYIGPTDEIEDATIYVPSKANTKFCTEVAQKLTLQFNQVFTTAAVIDELCVRTSFFEGISHMSTFADSVLVEVLGKAKVISPYLKEITESEFRQKRGK